MTVIGGGGGGVSAPQRETSRGRRSLTLGQLIIYGIIGLIALFVLVTNPSLALYLLASILSGGGGRRDRDGWGGGGGGWSGGGGRSGGGGASGSW
jgi:uncharacterized protein